MTLPPLFAVLRRIGKRKAEIVDMFRYRKNADSCAESHRTGLARAAEHAEVKVWVERYEPKKRRRRVGS